MTALRFHPGHPLVAMLPCGIDEIEAEMHAAARAGDIPRAKALAHALDAMAALGNRADRPGDQHEVDLELANGQARAILKGEA